MAVESLMSGLPEPTNLAYATAKRTGLTLCAAYREQYGANFIAGIPANVFGPGDEFGTEDSHVVPALIVKLHEARIRALPSVTLWGTGNARRDFLYSEDLADACLFLMRAYGGPAPINIGGNASLSIRDLAEALKGIVDYRGTLRFDAGHPDGMPEKILDAGELAALGWRPRFPFPESLRATYEWYLGRERAACSPG
jgi:GDP-L-fucose synthase